MATMPSYQIANRMTLGDPGVTDESKGADVSVSPDAIARAEQAYAQELQKARVGSVISFFIAAALAVAAHGAASTAMLVFLAISAVSSASSKPLARRQFRLEIERSLRKDGLSAKDAQSISETITANAIDGLSGNATLP